MATTERAVALASLFVLSMVPPAWSGSPVPPDGVISVPGKYRLSSDKASSERFTIRVDAENVTLDLSGRTVRCAPDDPYTAETYGILIRGDNVTIRNGTVSGCYMGGYTVPGAANVRWEFIDFIGNRYIGVTGGSAFIGLSFSGFKGHSAAPYVVGINLPSSDCEITGNEFRDIERRAGAPDEIAGEGVGVIFSPKSTGCVARHNWHENMDTSHLDIGYWVGDADVAIEENTLTDIGRAIAVAPEGTVAATNNRLALRAPQPGSIAIGAQYGEAVGNFIIGYDLPVDGNIPDHDNLILP